MIRVSGIVSMVEGEQPYVVSANDTVEELESANDNEESHEDINQLDALGGILDVAVPRSQSNLLGIVGVADGRFGRGGFCGCSDGLGGLRRG